MENNPNETEKPAEPSAAEKIEAENKRLEEALKKRDELITRQAMGGKSEAGVAPPPRDKEKEKIERVNAWLARTGMIPFPQK